MNRLRTSRCHCSQILQLSLGGVGSLQQRATVCVFRRGLDKRSTKKPELPLENTFFIRTFCFSLGGVSINDLVVTRHGKTVISKLRTVKLFIRLTYLLCGEFCVHERVNSENAIISSVAKVHYTLGSVVLLRPEEEIGFSS